MHANTDLNIVKLLATGFVISNQLHGYLCGDYSAVKECCPLKSLNPSFVTK